MKEKERKHKRERLNIIVFVNYSSIKKINHTWPKQKKTEQTKNN